MYSVLLVDDERPALTYLNSIFQKYLPDFSVVGMVQSAQEALDALSQQPIDILLTDISMSGGMNGVELAQRARALYPQLHIIIVSGYAEFEYARGALQAGVEEYLLKPISITRVRETMEKVLASLTQETASQRIKLLSDLITGAEVDAQAVKRVFDHEQYRFVVVRFGNLTRLAKLRTVDPCLLNAEGWTAFYGHDEQELILLRRVSAPTPHFMEELSTLLEKHANGAAYTAVYDTVEKPVRRLPGFLEKAFPLLYKSLVIGLSQCLPITYTPPTSPSALPLSLRRQLSSFVSSASLKLVRSLFVSLAIEWERARVPQEHVQMMCVQLLSTIIEADSLRLGMQLDHLNAEIQSLCANASSVGELLASLYDLIFDDSSTHDQRVSSDELCEYTLTYIRENYAQPLSIQLVCSKIGISQSYLSRLLRKHANTSVNTYLTYCRIEAAKKLLREHPDMVVREVASCVGYDDQSYFSKIFRAETGMTPKAFAASVVS